MAERTVPIPESIEKVHGYNTLTIYKMASGSPYWYVRYYEKGRIYRKSTKQLDKARAIQAAKDFFAAIKVRAMNATPLTKQSGFEVCAWGLHKENEARVARKEISDTKVKYDRARLQKDILPFFGKYEAAQVDYALLSKYRDKFHDEARPLSTNSLKIHFSHIKTILRYAQRMGVIQSLPAFPAFKTVDKPRGWFSSQEYNKLHNTARANVGKTFSTVTSKGEQRRNVTLTQELYDLILFMTNTFIRPTDIKVLRHRHIEVVTGEHDYLRLRQPATKNHSSPTISMPAAIGIYERILARQRAEGYGKPDDFVFQPEHADNRDYALRQLHRQFDQLLKMTSLKVDAHGQPRSLYSLRHTAITFRLLHSENLKPLTLARGSRTSFEVIERFYAKHLTVEMDVEAFQSIKKPSKRPSKPGPRTKATATKGASRASKQDVE